MPEMVVGGMIFSTEFAYVLGATVTPVKARSEFEPRLPLDESADTVPAPLGVVGFVYLT